MDEWLPLLWLLWPVVGWCCAIASTPSWMVEQSPGTYTVLCLFCGAVVGPFGVLWLLDSTSKKKRC